jgi:hypothetical protein
MVEQEAGVNGRQESGINGRAGGKSEWYGKKGRGER